MRQSLRCKIIRQSRYLERQMCMLNCRDFALEKSFAPCQCMRISEIPPVVFQLMPFPLRTDAAFYWHFLGPEREIGPSRHLRHALR